MTCSISTGPKLNGHSDLKSHITESISFPHCQSNTNTISLFTVAKYAYISVELHAGNSEFKQSLLEGKKGPK